MRPAFAPAGTRRRSERNPSALDGTQRGQHTSGMIVALHASQSFRCRAAPAFALLLDPIRFPPMFRGFGPIPAIRRIDLPTAAAVGVTRSLENSDGSRPTERITALDPPRHHAYTLSGLSAPFRWLVHKGEADWHFDEVDAAAPTTQVRWDYRFELTSVLAWPLAYPLLTLLMATAMRRCLAAMARQLDSKAA